MVVDPATRRSAFDALKAPPKAATLGRFKERLQYMLELDALGPAEVWLRGIPRGKVGHFAGETRVTDVADLSKMKDDAKRLTLLASLIHVLRAAARDEVTDMFCKRMAIIHRKGRDRLEDLREEHRAESERLLEVFGEVLAAAREASELGPLEGIDGAAGDEDGGRAVNVSAIGPPDGVADDKAEDPAVDADPDGAGEEVAVLKTLESGGGLEQLMAAHQAVASFDGNNYLPLLEAFYRSHRAVLFTLVDAIELEATSAECGVLDALEFIRAVWHRRGEWIEETCAVNRG
jgi:hypothetical protein